MSRLANVSSVRLLTSRDLSTIHCSPRFYSRYHVTRTRYTYTVKSVSLRRDQSLSPAVVQPPRERASHEIPTIFTVSVTKHAMHTQTARCPSSIVPLTA